MRTVIVNFANEAGWYRRGQDRLKVLVGQHSPESDFLCYTTFEAVGAPPHDKIPYGFKVYALWNAMMHGYDMAIYCDASVYPIKSMEPVWNLIQKDGVFLEQLEPKHSLGAWSSDICLANLGIDREVAFGIPCLIAGCVGFDFTNQRARQLLSDWMQRANDGTSFQGAWVNDRQQVSSDLRVLGHRHDQSVLSGLVWQQKWPSHPFRTYIAYLNTMEMPETAVFNINPA